MAELCYGSMKTKKTPPPPSSRQKKPMWKKKIEREIQHMQGALTIVTEIQRKRCRTLKGNAR